EREPGSGHRKARLRPGDGDGGAERHRSRVAAVAGDQKGLSGRMTAMWPVTMEDVRSARERIRDRLPPTALRRYPPLDDAVGYGIRVYVKHENHQPTQAFKARNALSALTTLSPDEKKRGVVGASRGNHGQALAWAGQLLGIPVVISVPRGNNPEQTAAMRAFGADATA